MKFSIFNYPTNINFERNRLSALNFAGSWFQLKVAYDSSVFRSPGTPIRGHTPVRQAG